MLRLLLNKKAMIQNGNIFVGMLEYQEFVLVYLICLISFSKQQMLGPYLCSKKTKIIVSSGHYSLQYVYKTKQDCSPASASINPLLTFLT